MQSRKIKANNLNSSILHSLQMKIKNVWKNSKKRFMNSLFLKSILLIQKNKKTLFYIFLFDVLFLASLYGIQTLFRYVPPLGNFWFGILLSIAYFFILVFVYSFFKYIVLEYVVLFAKDKRKGKLKEFFILNLLIFAPLLFVMLLINIILVFSLKTNYLPLISSIISMVIAFFLYPFINFSHSLFAQGKKWKKSLVNSLNFTFKRIKSYLPVYGFGVVVFLLLYAVFNLIWLVLRFTVPEYSLGSVFNIFTNVYSVISMILLYKIILFNRFYFYLITKK